MTSSANKLLWLTATEDLSTTAVLHLIPTHQTSAIWQVLLKKDDFARHVLLIIWNDESKSIFCVT